MHIHLSMNILKIKISITLLMLCLLTNVLTITAQIKKPLQKFKQPKLTISLGGFKDSSFISPTQLEQIIILPLKIVDAKNEEKIISTYNIVYRKIVTSEDEETGKTYSTTSVKNALLRVTPLPNTWVNALTENPKPREEIIFYDIIVKDKQGNLMFAPTLKLYIK